MRKHWQTSFFTSPDAFSFHCVKKKFPRKLNEFMCFCGGVNLLLFFFSVSKIPTAIFITSRKKKKKRLRGFNKNNRTKNWFMDFISFWFFLGEWNRWRWSAGGCLKLLGPFVRLNYRTSYRTWPRKRTSIMLYCWTLILKRSFNLKFMELPDKNQLTWCPLLSSHVLHYVLGVNLIRHIIFTFNSLSGETRVFCSLNNSMSLTIVQSVENYVQTKKESNCTNKKFPAT